MDSLVRYLWDHESRAVTINGFNFQCKGLRIQVLKKSILAFRLLFNYN